MTTPRPELHSSILMAKWRRSGRTSRPPEDFAAVLVAAGAEHYGKLHPAERVAELLDEVSAAAGYLAAKIEPESERTL